MVRNLYGLKFEDVYFRATIKRGAFGIQSHFHLSIFSQMTCHDTLIFLKIAVILGSLCRILVR
jgi:hypothetical protein